MKLFGSTKTFTSLSGKAITLSSGRGSASDHSNRYEKPVQPPARIPTRRPLGAFSRLAAAFLISCTARSLTVIAIFVIPLCLRGLLLVRCHNGGARRGRSSCGATGLTTLAFVVCDGALDGVLGQDRTVDLHWWQIQLLDDLRVPDLHRLVDRHS